jgi:hypothetical protein
MPIAFSILFVVVVRGLPYIILGAVVIGAIWVVRQLLKRWLLKRLLAPRR